MISTSKIKFIISEFAQAAKLLKEEGLNVKLARVDAIKETDVMAENEVKMYPTLKWFVKGEAFKYKGNKFGQVIISKYMEKLCHSNAFL